MNNNTEQILFEKVKKWAFLLNICPFVKAVFICNSLSYAKVGNESDIDLFVISKRKRVYLSRLFLTIFLKFFRLRTNKKYKFSRFCLSFFVDEDSFNFNKFKHKNDYYLAFWIKSLKPVLLNNFDINLFFNKNKWINDYFLDDFINFEKLPLYSKKSFIRNFLELFFISKIGDFFEFLNYKIQFYYLNKTYNKKNFLNSSILINKNVIKLHKNDKRWLFNSNFEKQFGKNTKIDNSNFLSILP